MFLWHLLPQNTNRPLDKHIRLKEKHVFEKEQLSSYFAFGQIKLMIIGVEQWSSEVFPRAASNFLYVCILNMPPGYSLLP